VQGTSQPAKYRPKRGKDDTGKGRVLKQSEARHSCVRRGQDEFLQPGGKSA
jgi:hypothetical protein